MGQILFCLTPKLVKHVSVSLCDPSDQNFQKSLVSQNDQRCRTVWVEQQKNNIQKNVNYVLSPPCNYTYNRDSAGKMQALLLHITKNIHRCAKMLTHYYLSWPLSSCQTDLAVC